MANMDFYSGSVVLQVAIRAPWGISSSFRAVLVIHMHLNMN
jgi:hypothetical protein